MQKYSINLLLAHVEWILDTPTHTMFFRGLANYYMIYICTESVIVG